MKAYHKIASRSNRVIGQISRIEKYAVFLYDVFMNPTHNKDNKAMIVIFTALFLDSCSNLNQLQRKAAWPRSLLCVG